MKSMIKLVSIAALMALWGCSEPEAEGPSMDADVNATPTEVSETTEQLQEQTDIEQKDMMTLTGTIEYKEFEGGFFAFIADDGRHFTPFKLPKQFMQDGLRITFTGEHMPDMMTTTQFGTVINVVEVLDFDESAVKRKPVKPVNLDDI